LGTGEDGGFTKFVVEIFSFLLSVNLKGAIKYQNRLGGDTGRALLRNILNVKHYGPPTLLEFTSGEVLYDPFNSNKTRMTRVWKCSRRACLM